MDRARCEQPSTTVAIYRSNIVNQFGHSSSLNSSISTVASPGSDHRPISSLIHSTGLTGASSLLNYRYIQSASTESVKCCTTTIDQPLRRTMDWQSVTNQNRLPVSLNSSCFSTDHQSNSIDSIDSSISSSSSSSLTSSSSSFANASNQNLDPNSNVPTVINERNRDESADTCRSTMMSDGKRSPINIDLKSCSPSSALSNDHNDSIRCQAFDSKKSNCKRYSDQSQSIAKAASIPTIDITLPGTTTVDRCSSRDTTESAISHETIESDEQYSQDSNDSTITNRSRDSDQQFDKSCSSHRRGRALTGRKLLPIDAAVSSPRDSNCGLGDETAEIGWECSVCTLRNPSDAFKCLICDVRKEMSTRKPRVNPQHLAAQVARQQQQIQEQALKASAKQAEKLKTPISNGSEQRISNEKRKIDCDTATANTLVKGKRRSDGSGERKMKPDPDSKQTPNNSDDADGSTIVTINARPTDDALSADSFDRSSCQSRQITVNNVTIRIVEYGLKRRTEDRPDGQRSSTGKKKTSMHGKSQSAI